MNELRALIAAHPATAALLAGWVASNVVAALPTPLPAERWYGALYKFLHLSVGNAPRVFPSLRLSGADKPDESTKGTAS